MQKKLASLLLSCIVISIGANSPKVFAQTHSHSEANQDIKPPRVFLDKNPRIVKYQLKRLSNARLLLVERSDDDPKYLLVHQEILGREGIAKGDLDDAVQAIANINDTDPVTELLALIPDVESEGELAGSAKQFVSLLLEQKTETLRSRTGSLVEATEADSRLLNIAGFAGLILTGSSEKAFELGSKNPLKMATLLESIPMIPSQKIRNSLNSKITAMLSDQQPIGVRLAAVNAMNSLTSDFSNNFKAIAPLVNNPRLRASAVRALLKIPRKNRDASVAANLASFLVKFAEDTPTAKRTSDTFIEAMQLADQTLGLLPPEMSDRYRKRLSAVSVRVILIHTVEEEMRYDVPWFAVQAGTDIQVILKNEDLMAHNLVITKPEALQTVALQAAAEGPTIGPSGKQYVPESSDVLIGTEMVSAEKQSRITFRAPSEPGEYPYVCTFPGHWMRMYGVMVVVDDLGEFQRNPTEPKDPVGSNRPLVKAWTIEDLNDKIEMGLRGRSFEIGKKIFNEATCAQCHQVGEMGKAVGPDLTDLWARWKGDAAGVLREVIEPSHKIEPKYIVRKVITLDGDVISGIVVAEDKETISILPNPESPEPTIIAQDDIDDMIKSSVSIMPKGLMDRFTEDEIFELLSYLRSINSTK
ncbi:MAG: c-type cytochrome [Mariniblastus sp.]|nr:c-type cytochrome [Mariniblastus sp.]